MFFPGGLDARQISVLIELPNFFCKIRNLDSVNVLLLLLSLRGSFAMPWNSGNYICWYFSGEEA